MRRTDRSAARGPAVAAELVAEIGDTRITKVREHEHQRPPVLIFENAAEVQAAIHDHPWLSEWCGVDGSLRIAFQAFIIETPSRVILLDPCIGNDRQSFIPGTPFHTTFLADLRQAIGDLDRVDVVAYTHLHLDHIGWSTHLVDGNWIPTFPRARHVLVGEEWEHWATGHNPSTDYDRAVDVSIRPLFEHGLVDLVDPGYVLAPEVRFLSTPGHSPGHVSVEVSSAGERAMITGDLIHHPVQLLGPRWLHRADHDQQLGAQMRVAAIEQLLGTTTLLVGTHFAGACAGYIEPTAGGENRFQTGSN